MLLRNRQPKNAHISYSGYIVESGKNDVSFVLISSGKDNLKRLILTRLPCEPGGEYFPFPGFKRTQFSVRVCFANTTYEAQCQPFGDAIGVDLNHVCFTHVHHYAAMSRTTHPSNIYVCKKRDDNTTTSGVYETVISTW